MHTLDHFQLKGQAALITGAATGLGRATALVLADAGAFIGVHYHSSEKQAAELLGEIRQRGSDGITLRADLCQEQDCNDLVDRFVAKAGRFDILVNNAGGLVASKHIEDCSLDVWDKTLALNLTSAFLVTRRAIPQLRATGKGRIVNIVSASMESGGTFGAGAYGVAKGALHVFTRTLAKEYGPQIRANAICPGVMVTQHHATTPPERLETYRQSTPMKRNGTAEDVALAVLYLASDASSFVSGALLDVTGGRIVR